MGGILDFFPSGMTPNHIQEAVLLEVERRWNQYDVFVINAPVASGKSAISLTIAEWAGQARIATPTNILVDQYNYAVTVKAATQLRCSTDNTISCGSVKADCGKYCSGCPYQKQYTKAKMAPVSVSTYHMLMALKSQRRVHIFDEAHNLVKFLRDIHTTKIWPHKFGIPLDCLGNEAKLRQWLASADSLPEQLDIMARELWEKNPIYVYDYTEDLWSGGGSVYGEKRVRGEPELAPLIRRYPINISNLNNPLWSPDPRQKLILMSATIGLTDLVELGLDQRKTWYIEAKSPIPVDRRPIYTDYVGSISRHTMSAMLPRLAAKINQYIAQKPEKGFIHMPYSTAESIRPLLKNPRLFFHTRTDTQKVLESFKKSKDGVMVGSGLYEGVSLDYDAARWQLISKVPWASLASPLQRYWTKRNPEYYEWTALKDLMQASGRVCRRPDDYGETIILDSTFDRLKDHRLAPQWFKEALVPGPGLVLA